MNNINQWLLSNKLTLNIEKTEYMIIGTRQRLARISKDIVSIEGNTPKQVYSKKTLGAIIGKRVSKGIGMHN